MKLRFVFAGVIVVAFLALSAAMSGVFQERERSNNRNDAAFGSPDRKADANIDTSPHSPKQAENF